MKRWQKFSLVCGGMAINNFGDALVEGRWPWAVFHGFLILIIFEPFVAPWLRCRIGWHPWGSRQHGWASCQHCHRFDYMPDDSLYQRVPR